MYMLWKFLGVLWFFIYLMYKFPQFSGAEIGVDGIPYLAETCFISAVSSWGDLSSGFSSNPFFSSVEA